MDIKKLPEVIQGILNDLLIPINPETPKEVLVLLLLVKIAQFLCFERFFIEGGISNKPVPPNIYALIFQASGSGKNRPLSQLNTYMFNDWHKEIESEWEIYEQEAINILQSKAEKRYGKKSKTKVGEYIDAYSPRRIQRTIRDGTAEGIADDREMYAQWGKGSTLTVIEEFSDYILSPNPHHREFLSVLKEVFDVGDLEAKSIKGRKDAVSTEDVPSNAILTSTMTGLREGKGFARLQAFLEGGFARRSFIIVTEGDKKLSIDGLKFSRETIQKWGSNSKLFDLLEKVKRQERQLMLSDDALALHDAWHVKTHNNALKSRKEIVSVAEKGAYWKVYKLAGVLSAIQGENEIGVEPMESAIYLSDHCSREMNRLVHGIDPLKAVFKFIEQSGKDGVTTMDIRSERFVGWVNFTRWWKEMHGMLREYAPTRGYTLESKVQGRNGLRYRLYKNTMPDNSIIKNKKHAKNVKQNRKSS